MSFPGGGGEKWLRKSKVDDGKLVATLPLRKTFVGMFSPCWLCSGECKMKDIPSPYLEVQNFVQDAPLYRRRDKMPSVTYSPAASFQSSQKFTNLPVKRYLT